MMEDIKQYGLQLQKDLDPSSETHQKLIQKGLLLYRQQLVYQKKINENIVTAKVQDVTPVQVLLDLHNPSNNRCSCPQEEICRHQLALFFSVYSEADSVFEWIQNWKKSDSSFDILKNLKRGRDLLVEHSPADLTGVDAWLARFNQAYQGIDVGNEYVLEVTCKNKYRRLIENSPVEREWKPLYQLFAVYESVKIINRICLEHHIRTFKRFFDFLVQEADVALNKLSVSAAPFAFDPYLTYLREDCHLLLSEPTYDEMETAQLYQMLWSNLFKQNVWRKLEYQRLKNLKEETENKRIKVGFVHLAILCGFDEEALEQFQKYGTEFMIFSTYWLKYLKEQKSQNRFYHFLNAIISFLPDYLEQLSDFDRFAYIRSFFQSINESVFAEHNPTLLEKIYIQTLPHTYYQYSDHLFSKEKYKEWVELQHFRDIDIDYLDQSKLTVIAKSNPDLLMPIYHEAIDLLLVNRNRESYKKCVKYLKKLRTLYKKQKNVKVWESFLEDLLEKTKRLRAFHEECKRGKLIDA